MSDKEKVAVYEKALQQIVTGKISGIYPGKMRDTVYILRGCAETALRKGGGWPEVKR